jgi:chromosome segregation ATPase
LAGEKEQLKSSHETMRSLGLQIADKELKVSTLEGDLRIEREWRQSLQDTLVKDKERISELNMEVQKLQLVGLVNI